MYMFILFSVPHSLDYSSFVISLKLGSINLPIVLFFFKIVFAVLWPLPFLINFKINVLVSEGKKSAGILIRITLNA